MYKIKQTIKETPVYPFLYRLLECHRRRPDKRLFRRHLRPTDVFLVGHPKSGNTWVAYMFANIIFADSSNEVTLANVGNYIPAIHGHDTRIKEYSKLPDPRVFRNENPVYPRLYPKAIYLVRDPRAVLVSYYHMYLTLFNDYSMTLKAFVEEYLSQGCIRRWEVVPRWDEQVMMWLHRAKYNKNIIIVRYEDMVRKRSNSLERIVGFANIPCNTERLKLAGKRGSFDAMRADEEQHGAESYLGDAGKRGRFVRQGKIDGWKDEMEGSVVDAVERELAPAMKAAGYL